MAPWSAAFGAVAAVTIAGNALSIAVFRRSHRLRRMRTSLLLLSLSAADLIVGALAIPLYVLLVREPGSELARSRALHTSQSVTDLASGFASLFGLAAIALERVYSVFWPHKHRALTKAPYLLALLASWGVAALLATLRALQGYALIPLEAFFFAMFSSMSAVVICIIASYVAVWVRVAASRKCVSGRGAHERSLERESRTLVKTLALLTALFLVTWLPFHVLNVVLFLCVPCRDCPLQLVYAIKLLHYSNSLVNPVVYSFRFPEFRRTLARLLCRAGRAVEPRSSSARQTDRGRTTIRLNLPASPAHKRAAHSGELELSAVTSADELTRTVER